MPGPVRESPWSTPRFLSIEIARVDLTTQSSRDRGRDGLSVCVVRLVGPLTVVSNGEGRCLYPFFCFAVCLKKDLRVGFPEFLTFMIVRVVLPCEKKRSTTLEIVVVTLNCLHKIRVLQSRLSISFCIESFLRQNGVPKAFLI